MFQDWRQYLYQWFANWCRIAAAVASGIRCVEAAVVLDVRGMFARETLLVTRRLGFVSGKDYRLSVAVTCWTWSKLLKTHLSVWWPRQWRLGGGSRHRLTYLWRSNNSGRTKWLMTRSLLFPVGPRRSRNSWFNWDYSNRRVSVDRFGESVYSKTKRNLPFTNDTHRCGFEIVLQWNRCFQYTKTDVQWKEKCIDSMSSALQCECNATLPPLSGQTLQPYQLLVKPGAPHWALCWHNVPLFCHSFKTVSLLLPIIGIY